MDAKYVSHFMGVKTGDDGVYRPNMQHFYMMRSNKLRVLYRSVGNQVPLDTLGDLINHTKRLVNAIFRLNEARLNLEMPVSRVADVFIKVTDRVVTVLQGFRAFTVLPQPKGRGKFQGIPDFDTRTAGSGHAIYSN